MPRMTSALCLRVTLLAYAASWTIWRYDRTGYSSKQTCIKARKAKASMEIKNEPQHVRGPRPVARVLMASCTRKRRGEREKTKELRN
ncbi:hypothetical protein HDV62DRAFT_360163 [Trichoderma sp. SZMC 28011]